MDSGLARRRATRLTSKQFAARRPDQRKQKTPASLPGFCIFVFA
jgi:hypothetical protein